MAERPPHITRDRVRDVSSDQANLERDEEIRRRVQEYATRPKVDLDRRIRELDREWDMERTLITNAATLALSSLVLSRVHSRRWLALTGVVAGFLLQHGLQGWCPPVELFRRLGVRTRKEIDQEKSALQALRGDFDSLRGEGLLH